MSTTVEKALDAPLKEERERPMKDNESAVVRQDLDDRGDMVSVLLAPTIEGGLPSMPKLEAFSHL